MNIINDKKVSLIAKLIISYLLLLDFAFLFYVFNTDPTSDQTARGTVLTNLLVWTATLFTPIAAYFFYDSWKDQKKYQINLDQIYKILERLTIIRSELLIMRSNISNMQNIDTNKSVNYIPKYLKKDINFNYRTIFEINSYTVNYTIFNDDEELEEEYKKLELKILLIPTIYDEVINRYHLYCQDLIQNINEIEINKDNTYIKKKTEINIEFSKIIGSEAKLLDFINSPGNLYTRNVKNGEILSIEKLTPYEAINDVLKKINSFIMICNKKLKLYPPCSN